MYYEEDKRSKYLRSLVLRCLFGSNRGHMGSAMSLIEILRVLYDNIIKYDARSPKLKNRDRLILSKGHGCLALYSLLSDKGFFPKEELSSFCKFESKLGGHPERGKVPGVEASTGALGHGLPIGVGMAIAGKLNKKSLFDEQDHLNLCREHKEFRYDPEKNVDEHEFYTIVKSAKGFGLGNQIRDFHFPRRHDFKFYKIRSFS